MNPIGGTELQYKLLEKYIDAKLLDNFQITTSVPEKIPLAKDKINILWQQNSYDQPNLAGWFKDKDNPNKNDISSDTMERFKCNIRCYAIIKERQYHS